VHVISVASEVHVLGKFLLVEGVRTIYVAVAL